MEYRPEQKKLELMVGDFVKAELPYFDVCISNTPYQVGLSPAGFKPCPDDRFPFTPRWTCYPRLSLPAPITPLAPPPSPRPALTLVCSCPFPLTVLISPPFPPPPPPLSPPDLLPTCLQAPLPPPSNPHLRPNVPTRIRPPTRRPPFLKTMVSTLRQRPTLRPCRTSHESWTWQFPSPTTSRVFRREIESEGSTAERGF